MPTAKNQQPSVVQLSPTAVFGPNALGSEEKTEKLWKRSPRSETSSSLVAQAPNTVLPTAFPCFVPIAERHKKGLPGKRFKEHGKGVERAFEMSSPKRHRHICEWEKPREPRQTSLLAKKILQECCPEPEDGVGGPMSSLVDRDFPAENSDKFSMGDKVEVRDRCMPEWRSGTVTSIRPLRVTLPEWDEPLEWDFVRLQKTQKLPLQEEPKSCRWSKAKLWKSAPTKENEIENDCVPIASPPFASPASQCSCGNRFQRDAIFCSRCGRQRGCEVLNSTSVAALKPRHTSSPRTCAPLSANPPMQRTASDFVSWLRRHREAERTFPLPDFYSEDGHPHQAASQSTGFRSEAAMAMQGDLNFCKTWSSRQAVTRPASSSSYRSRRGRVCDLSRTESSTSLVSVRRMNRQHRQWQQLTVPILAENGEIINLCPLGQDGKGVWQQNTVPILGERGEIIALRPAAGDGLKREWRPDTLPIFNEHGTIVALPSGGRCEWPSESVPIITEKGEVVGIRPILKHEDNWKQRDVPIFGASGTVLAICPSVGSLKRWEYLTVPLRGDNGEVIYLHPPVEGLDKPTDEVPVAKPADFKFLSSSGSSNAWNRTNVPPSFINQIRRRSRSESAIGIHMPKSNEVPIVALSVQSPKGHGQRGQDVFLTEISPGSTCALEDEALSSCSALSASPKCKDPHGEQEAAAIEPVGIEKDDAGKIAQTGSRRPSHLSPLHIPSSPCANACVASPDTQRTSASIDSFASMREAIRIANDAKQATPEGHVLQVLQEALASNRPGSPGPSVSSLLQMDAPETREIAERLEDLPELWRNTILKLLDEAESLQVPGGIPCGATLS